MLIQIKKWTDGSLMHEIEADNLKAAVELLVNKSANLYEANLRGANLCEANLREANLYGAKGINKFLTTPLYMLTDQPGLIRAYKLVTSKNTGPHYPSITYKIGQKHEVPDADCDENKQCAEGISLATLDWVMREWQPGNKILVAEFRASDIACIPVASDGKFRVSRCEIVGEKDLKELGLIKNEVREDEPSESYCLSI